EDLTDLALEAEIQHRERDLDTAVEIARHPVRGGKQIFSVPTVLEVGDPRVLEVAVDDGDDTDSRREPGPLGAPGNTCPAGSDRSERPPRWRRTAPRSDGDRRGRSSSR